MIGLKYDASSRFMKRKGNENSFYARHGYASHLTCFLDGIATTYQIK